MATIKRIKATQSQIDEAKAANFAAGYGFSDGQILSVKEAGFISHEVDGIIRGATPVLFLENSEEVVYIRSFLKERYNYKGELTPVTGTLNLFVRTLAGKTVGEVVEELDKRLKGKKIKALRKTYMGINRNGDIQPISYNEFNFMD